MTPILSIVIPTRNREKYCIEAIKCILGYDDQNFELIIQDNSDSDIIEAFVRPIVDNRLRYHRDPERLNSVINMDKAIGMASGEYVTMIGDDDTVMPNIFELTRWAKRSNVNCISSTFSSSFFWDEDGKLRGHLLTQPVSKKIKKYDAITQLKELLKGGIIDYQSYNLPKVYHGIMKRSVLEDIFKEAGHYIGGVSPDIYLAVSSCAFIKEYYVTYFPFTIPGACVKSTSVGNPRSSIKDMPHLWGRPDYIWDNRIPAYNSAQTVWAETALKALSEHVNIKSFDNLFNRDYFLSVFVLQNKDRQDEIIKECGIIPVKISARVRLQVKKTIGLFRGLKKAITRSRKNLKIDGSWPAVMEVLSNQVINI